MNALIGSRAVICLGLIAFPMMAVAGGPPRPWSPAVTYPPGSVVYTTAHPLTREHYTCLYVARVSSKGKRPDASSASSSRSDHWYTADPVCAGELQVREAPLTTVYSVNTKGYCATCFPWSYKVFSFVATNTTTTLRFRSLVTQSVHGIFLAKVSVSPASNLTSNLLLDGDFTAVPTGCESATTHLPGWSVTSGDIDTGGSSCSTYAPAGVQAHIDLTGTSPGTIEQSFATDVGEIYVVRFWLGGNSFGQETGTVAIKSLVATIR